MSHLLGTSLKLEVQVVLGLSGGIFPDLMASSRAFCAVAGVFLGVESFIAVKTSKSFVLQSNETRFRLCIYVSLYKNFNKNFFALCKPLAVRIHFQMVKVKVKWCFSASR